MCSGFSEIGVGKKKILSECAIDFFKKTEVEEKMNFRKCTMGF